MFVKPTIGCITLQQQLMATEIWICFTKPDGPSMNRATIDNKRIEDGDYVIIDSDDCVPKDGDIVLSIIDGMANIKRFHWDKKNRQIALAADSTLRFPPIYIHESDAFSINGKVIQVVKKPEKRTV